MNRRTSMWRLRHCRRPKTCTIADVDTGYQKRINIFKELPSVGNNMFTGFPRRVGELPRLGLRFLGLIFHC
jgi:hypothetical protein